MNATKAEVYRRMDELKDAVARDVYNLTRDSQNGIEVRIDGLREFIDEMYRSGCRQHCVGEDEEEKARPEA